VTGAGAIAKVSSAERVKRAVNLVLTKTTGYQLTRAANADLGSLSPALKPGVVRKRVNRQVERPTFIITSVRSGSTLLRVILNSHSQICAPHELHLGTVHVSIGQSYGKESMRQIGLNEQSLEHLLWDRILQRELAASGKRLIVDKTPQAVFHYERLTQAWPKARFIFLLRHPAAIADSLFRLRKDPVMADVQARVLQYVDQIELARAALTGLTVRYEDLVAEPERVSRELCAFLEVPWERSMLDYGSFDHGGFKPRMGDWSEKIKSGQIDNDIVLPTADEVPEELRDACRRWGYLP
jgi:hypothetical protein